jgi:hypothetical protein
MQERPPSTLKNVNDGPPWEVPELEIRECLPLMLKASTTGPMGGADRDPGAPTINVKKTSTVGPLAGANGDPRASTINIKKHQRRVPWEVPELEIQVCLPLLLGNVDGRPLGGCR